MINANIITSRYLELNTHTQGEKARERGGADRKREKEKERQTEETETDRQRKRQKRQIEGGDFFKAVLSTVHIPYRRPRKDV